MELPKLLRNLSVGSATDQEMPQVNHTGEGKLGLRVDTTVLRDYKSKMRTFDTSTLYEQQPQVDDHRSASPPPTTGNSMAGGNVRSESGNKSSETNLRRRRSNSECLFLAKNRSMDELPGQCKEYIDNVKQILARSEDQHNRRDGISSQRRRSSSLRNSSVFKEAVMG